jgi:hypothetical protein
LIGPHALSFPPSPAGIFMLLYRRPNTVATANQRLVDLAGRAAGTINVGMPPSFWRPSNSSLPLRGTARDASSMPASGLKQPLRNESWKLTGLIATPDLVRHSDWAAILPPVAVIDEARGGRRQRRSVIPTSPRFPAHSRKHPSRSIAAR